MTAPRHVLFSAVRNEAPFLLEWIAYHRAIGFDHFVIVSNDSDDGTTELLDALAAQGIIHHIHHSVEPGQSPQGEAALAANEAGLIADGDWVIWLDADEFLNIHTGKGHVQDLTAAMGEARAMLIPWRIFGDSGNATFPGRFVSPAFTGAAEPQVPANFQIKTFFRHLRGGMELAPKSPHRPALARGGRFVPDDILSAAGRPMTVSDKVTRNWLAGVTAPANASIPPEDFSWDLVQINHYSVRTPEFFALKRLRGRGFLNKRANTGTRHTDKFYQANNRNEAEDRTILRHQAATTRNLNRLLAGKAISDAHQAAIRRTAEKLATLQEAEQNLPQTHMPDAAATPPAPQNPDASDASKLFVPVFTMPDAEQAFVTAQYAAHDVILEYGSGGSTLMAAAQEHALVMSVESDQAWSENLQKVLNRDYPQANIRLHWADIGPTGKWGRPVNHRAWRKFVHYPLGVWDMPWFRHPDLILIDGRFRVGCLLAALFRIERPVTVLVDDYTPRPHYISAIESFVRPVEIVGRLARFELEPTPYPVARMAEITDMMIRVD